MLLALACARPNPSPSQPTAALGSVESLYADLRDLRDHLDVAASAGRTPANDARPFTLLIGSHNHLRADVTRRLAEIDSSGLGAADARAYGLMRRALQEQLDSLPPPSSNLVAESKQVPDCGYAVGAVAAAVKGLDSLRKRLYGCYGWSQSHIVIGRDTLDRLTVLSLLGKVDDERRRRELFLGLEPVWRNVNRDNRPESPYRRLIALEIADGRRNRVTGQVRASGVPPDSLEPWLVAILTTWREAGPDSLVEPWNWFYTNGGTSRALGPRISREQLTQLNQRVYRSLGADPVRLRVQYDLDPRDGKTPVAFTTFGARPRFMNGSWRAGEPWVFATYRTGGLDNLNEILHETGHAVHIAAIRTRPAFADWPDSDPFTEAVADLIALDVYEPAWQQRWLGDSVPLADGLRGRYGGIVMDVAWAVFELEMLRQPGADPNQVWTRLTSDYLRIRPHPELSWWAMRGQLIDSPGYMMNYAVGAMISAAIRARTRAVHGAMDSTWYGWIAPRLYRFGLERPSSEVLEEFLGGPVRVQALLDDMRRMAR
jgi:hypothetical protein